jgi:sorting nexin-25
MVANMVGTDNARRGGERLFSALQRRPLNKHLVYVIFDEVWAALFPEIATARTE